MSRLRRYIDDLLFPFKLRRFYGQFLRRGDLAFDVGANMGNRTEAFLQLGARVVAVEPQPKCVAALEQKFGTSPHFVIVPSALGESEGEESMSQAQGSEVASLSKEWISTVKESGRFSRKGYDWKETIMVPVTTLDLLIAKHGAPAFIKIDVEGYEYQVIRGLTQPVRALSLEFTPELIEPSIKVVEYLATLGNCTFNYSFAESFRWQLPAWVDAVAMVQQLRQFRDRTTPHGDFYVRFAGV